MILVYGNFLTSALLADVPLYIHSLSLRPTPFMHGWEAAYYNDAVASGSAVSLPVLVILAMRRLSTHKTNVQAYLLPQILLFL